MVPKVKTPKMPAIAEKVELKSFKPDDTARAYSSLISTSGGAQGLLKPAKTVKKSLLGG